EGHRQDDVPPIALEDAAAVGESTLSRGELAHLVVGAVEDPYGDDAFGHLLAVRADVLDRRRARRSRDTGEALEAGEPLTDRVLHDLIPHVARLNGEPDAVVAGPLGPDSRGADQHHAPVDSRIGD